MHKTIFGTDGIRCQMNSSYLTETNLKKLGQAIGQWAPSQSHFVFGSDTRSSCKEIQNILARELLSHNHTISNAGVIPTPMLCTLIQDTPKYNFGIMITASHNPAQDNGLKIITSTQKLSVSDELEISRLFWGEPDSETSSHTKKIIENLNAQEISHRYVKKIKKQLLHSKFDQFKIVVDCAHGATSSYAPDIFKEFGFDTVTINNQPNGKNINQQAGALYPEQLLQEIHNHNADFGCAFDGDGDRLVITTRKGTILNGDDLLTIFAEHPRYQNEQIVAGTIMSNQAVENYFATKNKKFIRTDVGDKNIVTKLTEHSGLLGSEPSGHIIIQDHSFCSDGIFGALLFFDTILAQPTITIPLFQPYPSVQKNITVTEKKNLKADPIATMIKTYEKKLYPGRLIIRYSGTEPLLRVSIEYKDKAIAGNLLNNLVNELKSYLS